MGNPSVLVDHEPSRPDRPIIRRWFHQILWIFLQKIFKGRISEAAGDPQKQPTSKLPSYLSNHLPALLFLHQKVIDFCPTVLHWVSYLVSSLPSSLSASLVQECRRAPQPTWHLLVVDDKHLIWEGKVTNIEALPFCGPFEDTLWWTNIAIENGHL